MLKAALELSPLDSTSVPPDKTGLVPTEPKPTLVPLEIVETLVPLETVETLVPLETVEMVVLPEDEPELLPALPATYAVMSKFQMPDPDVVSLRAKA
jgi:hypothetical protein